jgi:hypothetical protein
MVVVVRSEAGQAEASRQRRRFGAMVSDLRQLCAWLIQQGVPNHSRAPGWDKETPLAVCRKLRAPVQNISQSLENALHTLREGPSIRQRICSGIKSGVRPLPRGQLSGCMAIDNLLNKEGLHAKQAQTVTQRLYVRIQAVTAWRPPAARAGCREPARCSGQSARSSGRWPVPLAFARRRADS